MAEQIGVHFNPSTLKAQYNDVTKKLIVSSYEYGDDCCCFLDPDTPVWDAETTYSLGDIVQRAGSGIFRSKADNNLNHQPPDTDWWTQLTTVNPCGNTDWDKWLGYGGPGRTPKYMTVTFSGLVEHETDCWEWPSKPNRKFVLVQGGDPCQWGCGSGWDCDYTAEWEGNDKWVCSLKIDSNTYLVLYHAPFEDLSGCCYAFINDTEIACNMIGEVIDNQAEGSAIFVPGRPIYKPWLYDNNYVVNEQVIGTDDQIYTCILNHTATLDDKPITGANWETYWELPNQECA